MIYSVYITKISTISRFNYITIKQLNIGYILYRLCTCECGTKNIRLITGVSHIIFLKLLIQLFLYFIIPIVTILTLITIYNYYTYVTCNGKNAQY